MESGVNNFELRESGFCVLNSSYGMSDSFTNSEKEKLLESLVSPIKKKERRYSDFDMKKDELNSAASPPSDNSS